MLQLWFSVSLHVHAPEFLVVATSMGRTCTLLHHGITHWSLVTVSIFFGIALDTLILEFRLFSRSCSTQSPLIGNLPTLLRTSPG